jgi:NAD(P)-dependent dehydrogenase (short-subunit alcohol dehydrogenase family)
VSRWTTADIPDLFGCTVVVTGANSGLGFETSLALARARATVVLACRDQSKAAVATEKICDVVGEADIKTKTLDLSSLSSVREFSKQFSESHEFLDILVNNAGVMAIPRRETTDGFEMQFGTNHLGHFALTGLLLDKLVARGGARVVNVSSEVARIGRIRFDDLQGRRSYSKWRTYGMSKLANQLFTLELDRRGAARGITSVASHPGYAATNLQGVGPRMSGSRITERLTEFENALFAQNAAMGALPSLFAATDPSVKGAEYFGPDQLFGMHGHPKRVPFVRRAQDAKNARRLWEVSVELTGVDYAALGV